MTTQEKTNITVATTVNAPVEKVWKLWTSPVHITKWNSASDDWHTTEAENDLRKGGKFRSRMEAKDGSAGFDFEGKYTDVKEKEAISYLLDDGRKVDITFSPAGSSTDVTEVFEAEETHSPEMQRAGWQAILDNFKQYVESTKDVDRLNFEITIAAPVEKVYEVMLNAEDYKKWTAAFNPNSSYRGSWEKGSKILFIGTDEKGEEGGMVSRIRENIPNKYVSIEHLGMFDHGKEITEGPEVNGWAGAQENYIFEDLGGRTLLKIELDSGGEYESYFSETWPKALDLLKGISES